MTRYTRRLLLVFLIIIFCLIAPAVLFYAWGYNFDWQKKKPVMTGGIYLQSIPKKAEIELNPHTKVFGVGVNDRLKNQTPRLLKRLIPQEYGIKLTKDGYHHWQKKLKVESRLVTEARNIFLVPKNPIIELVKNNLTDDFLLEKFLESQGGQEQNFTQQNKNLFPATSTAGYKIIEQTIFYIQKPSYILYRADLSRPFPQRKNQEENYDERKAEDSAGLNQNQISISPLPEADYQIIISPNQKLAALSNKGQLYFLNSGKKIFENLDKNIKGAQFSNDNKKLLYFSPSEIWVYYLENILIQPYKKAGEKELITRLSQEIKHVIWYPKTNEHIIFTAGQSIKITELDGRENRNTIDFLESKAEQIAYDRKTEKLYFIEKEKLYGVLLE